MTLWGTVTVRLLAWVVMFCSGCPLCAQLAQRLSLTDGTPVIVQLDETISSAHAHVGDHLSFRVVRDVSVDGFTVIPAGSTASG
ncbi:MAG TPA: hypothetical protein VII23_12320, partial [Terriglobales bacterium]